MSWTVLGRGFFNFFKILPPFVKGDGGGEEVVVSGWGGGVCTAVTVMSIFFFLIGGFLFLSGVRTCLIGV